MRSFYRSLWAMVLALVILSQATFATAQVPPPQVPAIALPQPIGAPNTPPLPQVPANALPSPTSKEVIPGAMDVRFRDGSLLKVKLKDKQLELETPHGKLMIAVEDIHKIEVGVRLSAEERQRIDTAIKDLDHADASRRSAAAAELLSQEEKAYPALLQQAKSDDAGAAAQVEAVLEKLRSRVPAETLARCQVDVVHTTQSKIAGRLKGDTLRIGTLAFGDQDMKIADVRGMQSHYAETIVRLGPADLQKRLVHACPTARNIRVFMGDNGNLQVEVEVSAEGEIAALTERIHSLPEMLPYQNRREIRIQTTSPAPPPAMVGR